MLLAAVSAVLNESAPVASAEPSAILDINYLFPRLLVIAIIWFFINLSILHCIPPKVTLIGVYHSLINEPFREKVKKIFIVNLKLIIPILIAFNIVIRITIKGITPSEAFYISLPIALASLLSMRIISNPNKSVTDYWVQNIHTKDADYKYCVKLHEERILSFFSSFLCSAFIILGIYLCYEIFLSIALDGNQNLIPEFDYFTFACYLIVICVSVFLVTLFGEKILVEFPPKYPD